MGGFFSQTVKSALESQDFSTADNIPAADKPFSQQAFRVIAIGLSAD